VARTDWQAVVLTLLLPLLVAASFAYLALQPQWDDSGEWALGLLALLPLEFVRVIVLWILRDAYADYRSPAYAVRFFLLSLLILAVLCLIGSLWQIGVRPTLAALLEPDTWRMIGPPALVIAADGVIGLYFFRGDPHRAAARLEAQGDDAQDLFVLALYAFPLLVALPCFVVFVQVERGAQLPAWIPPGTDGIRAACLLYAAVYFAARGLLFAHAYSARFADSGARVLGARWIQFLIERDRDKRAANAAEEATKAARRRTTLGAARFVDADAR
jgi:hypothetical protein